MSVNCQKIYSPLLQGSYAVILCIISRKMHLEGLSSVHVSDDYATISIQSCLIFGLTIGICIRYFLYKNIKLSIKVLELLRVLYHPSRWALQAVRQMWGVCGSPPGWACYNVKVYPTNYWQTLMAHINIPEDGYCTAQMTNNIIKLLLLLVVVVSDFQVFAFTMFCWV